MRRCEFANAVNGQLGLEIPLARRVYAEVMNKRAADFGGVCDGLISSLRYGIDKSNEHHVFDIHPYIQVEGIERFENAHQVDLIYPLAEYRRYFDVATSISAIEHMGTGWYGDISDSDGDIKAVANMVETIAPGGSLYFSVPCSKVFEIFDGWIRSYSPETLRVRFPGFAFEYFRYADGWWNHSDEGDLLEKQCGIDCIAWATYKRGSA